MADEMGERLGEIGEGFVMLWQVDGKRNYLACRIKPENTVSQEAAEDLGIGIGRAIWNQMVIDGRRKGPGR